MASRQARRDGFIRRRTVEHGLAGPSLRLRHGLFHLAGLTPPHALALTLCVLTCLVGVAVADDYGIWGDTHQQRAIGEATLRHLAGERGLNLLWPPWNRLYGPIFETPLALVERLLGRDDSRLVFLSRHLLTHLFFVAAGFAGYLLALRLFGSRWLALFALLLFLLHPRIYAHSFFNSKDVPFLSLFMICLWLAHRAFGASGASGSSARGPVGAVALSGVAAGLLINLRIMGLVFVAMVALMCLCDIFAAGDREERRRAIVRGTLFALAAAAVFYATMPYLWPHPVTRFMEILEVLSAHPTDRPQLFQGELVFGSELPPSYLPVWFGITTPPLALLLGAVGLAALVWRILPRPLASLSRNSPLRFELFIAACFLLPVLAAIVLRPTLYSGWRHFYFLWAPFVLLATSGLRVLVEALRESGRTFLPLRLSSHLPSRVSVAAATGLAALGLATTVVEMTRLSPHQQLYFNMLADRPGIAEPLQKRFHLHDTFGAPHGYDHVVEELAGPGGHADAINIRPHTSEQRQRQFAQLGIAKPRSRDIELLRQRDQERFTFDPNADPDFYLRAYRRGALSSALFPPKLYERRLYGQPIVQLATPDLSRVDEATANTYRSIYRDVTSGTPALGGNIDVHRGETAITWVKESCRAGELHHTRDMTVVPLDAARERQTRRAYGVRVDDACLWQVPLPDYPIAKILLHDIGMLVSDAYMEERRRRYLALSATPPAARSTFDVYLEDGTLFYIRTPCDRADTEASFFVHVRPAHLGDIPQSRRRHGFEALDFRFGGFDPLWHYASGDIFDGVCMAALELPDYAIASVGTGQYAAGDAGLWRVDIGGA